MIHFRISKTIIFPLLFLLLLLLHPSKISASSDLSLTFYLSGDGTQTLYLPGPVSVKKVDIYACSVQNRAGGFQVDIQLLYEGAQTAYKGVLRYARSGCPMWSVSGPLDFGGVTADSIRIYPIHGEGTYYNMIVYYEESYEPPVIQCGSENTITQYANFSVPWGGGGDFKLPKPVKIHLVNLYGCCDQNRGGGCSDNIALLYNGRQVAYKGTLRYARSGCPMWSVGQSPPASALNFGGVLADTIRAVPTGRVGAAISRIYYTHEPEECTSTPTPTPPPSLPIITLTANGIRPQIKIAEGWSVNLDWSSTNADFCIGSVSTLNGHLNDALDWNGVKPANDSSPDYTYALANETIYDFSIRCTGPGGQSKPSRVLVDVVRPILTLERGSQTCLAVNLSWSWNDPWFNNEYLQYRVLRSDDGLVFSERALVNAPTMNYQDNDTFISDQTYYYRIEALKSGLPSVVSNTIETVPCPRLPGWEEIRPR